MAAWLNLTLTRLTQPRADFCSLIRFICVSLGPPAVAAAVRSANGRINVDSCPDRTSPEESAPSQSRTSLPDRTRASSWSFTRKATTRSSFNFTPFANLINILIIIIIIIILLVSLLLYRRIHTSPLRCWNADPVDETQRSAWRTRADDFSSCLFMFWFRSRRQRDYSGIRESYWLGLIFILKASLCLWLEGNLNYFAKRILVDVVHRIWKCEQFRWSSTWSADTEDQPCLLIV